MSDTTPVKSTYERSAVGIERLFRFDLRAMIAVTIGVAATFAMGRFDRSVAFIMTAALLPLWLVVSICRPERRKRVLLAGTAGAAAWGSMAILLRWVMLGAGTVGRMEISLVAAGTLLVGITVAAGPSWRRGIFRAIAAGSVIIVLLLAALTYRNRHEYWATSKSVSYGYRTVLPKILATRSSQMEDGRRISGLRQLLGISYARSLQIEVVQPELEMTHVGQLARLEWLVLSGNTLRDAHLQPLSNLRQLNLLSLDNTSVAGPGLRHLQLLPALNDLTIDDSAVGELDLTQVGKIRQLTSLRLAGAAVRDASLQPLSNLFKLQSLVLHHTAVEGHGFQHLTSLSALKTLHVSHAAGSETALRHIAQLTGLQYLRLEKVDLTPTGIRHLQRSRILYLSVSECRIEGETVSELVKLSSPRSIVLSKVDISDQDLQILQNRMTNVIMSSRGN